MTTCYPTPYQNTESKYGARIQPYQALTNPYGPGEYCETEVIPYFLLQEIGDFILLENSDKIIL